MNQLDSARFVRQVGFGLAPDEPTPADALAWAKGQLDSAPQPLFYRDRKGTLMDSAITSHKLLETQVEVAVALNGHEQAENLSFERSKTMSRFDWEIFRKETVDYPYWRLEPWKEVMVRAAMAVNGPAPVFERFWHFWTNHFTVSPSNNNVNTAVGPYQRMLRKRMTGKFRDMLFDAVTHPAMLLYLDNSKSTGPNSKARRERWTKDDINENLGRELLELFTVSPQAGYSQTDVQNTAYILTGWTVELPNKWHEPGVKLGTRFNFNKHEPGSQMVMGKRYGSVFRLEGKLADLIDELATHPATATHIAKKLTTAFISDDPSPDQIERVAKVFRESRGDLPTVHKAVLDEVVTSGSASRKFLQPETWLWTIHRLTGVELSEVAPAEHRGEKVHDILYDLGQPISNCPQPNGWSLFSRDWISREMLDRRIRYAFQFAPRIQTSDAWMRRIVARQHGAAHPISKLLIHSEGTGNSDRSEGVTDGKPIPEVSSMYGLFGSTAERSLWAAYLTSPHLLWS